MDWAILGPIIGTVIGGLLVGGNNLLSARTQREVAREGRRDEREAAREECKADRDHEHLKTLRQAYADLCASNAKLFDRAHYIPVAMWHLQDHNARTTRAEMQAIYGAEQKSARREHESDRTGAWRDP
jgi:hypothetical protein